MSSLSTSRPDSKTFLQKEKGNLGVHSYRMHDGAQDDLIGAGLQDDLDVPLKEAGLGEELGLRSKRLNGLHAIWISLKCWTLDMHIHVALRLKHYQLKCWTLDMHIHVALRLEHYHLKCWTLDMHIHVALRLEHYQLMRDQERGIHTKTDSREISKVLMASAL